jgi:cytochrome c553
VKPTRNLRMGCTILACSSAAFAFAQPAQTTATPPATTSLPDWAYASSGPSRPQPPTPSPTIRTEPGSTAPGWTGQQITDLFFVADWFPESHPPMPPIVSAGRKPQIGACGHCHLPTGAGRPENESVAGLPSAYFVQQLEDFKNGLRNGSDPHLQNAGVMVQYAKAMTPEEEKSAADYFASLKPVKWIRVVETDTVPRSHAAGGLLKQDPGTEPIGERVIELPEDEARYDILSSKIGFVAYVPSGSIKKGEALVKTGGNGETMACTLCHGADLKGVGDVPSIAGRSPSQMARQLFDFQTGARRGAGSALMKAPVARLTNSDIVAITAYLASLNP